MHRQAKITVSGLVQGVFFRAESQEKASNLGLAGWVKNNSNGTVSIVVSGEEAKINDFIQWCWKGPSVARVDQVAADWAEPTEEFETFNIRY